MEQPKYGTPEYEQYVQEERKRLEDAHGVVYNTTEVQESFEIEGFMAPLCYGKDKETGERVYLMFQHSPRFYWVS